MEEVDVPSYFTCPISLQIMRDPVILSSGITYERDAIERWLFSNNNRTCPLTKQPIGIEDIEPTPNHMLRRHIQSWCAANTSRGVERFPTPREPVYSTQAIIKILDSTKNPRTLVSSLRKLREMVTYSDRSKLCAENVGVPTVLVSIIDRSIGRGYDDEEEEESVSACDEALNILNSLQLSQESFHNLYIGNPNLIHLLVKVLEQSSSYQCRVYAIFLLKSIFMSISPLYMPAVEDKLYIEIVRVLRDGMSTTVTKAALRVLWELCPWGRNSIKATKAGAVGVLVDLLLDTGETKICEMIVIVLDKLCRCAEGREEIIRHGCGIAILSKKILRVSNLTSEKCVKILQSLVKYSPAPELLKEIAQLGVIDKLCLVLQMNCETKTKKIAKEILRLHSKTWKNSTCIHPKFLSSYPI
ncbi:U-box domain-containing protein [Zostera marina]|uniref:U-box domain-containing protein n=1 Tax=Zostera marina TaxID=29655 RepID=A0A0K9P833_ZOSMR|nr:U-box domain-containing protein [Zostera marina]